MLKYHPNNLVSLYLNLSQNCTIAISPAATPIKGLTAMTTNVSFQPPMKPTMNPNTKVEILSIKKDTWSAMALLSLLMSLRRIRTIYYVNHKPTWA